MIYDTLKGEWGASAVVSSRQIVPLLKPAYHSNERNYMLSLVNWSTVTGIDYKIQNIRTIGDYDIPVNITQLSGNLAKSTAVVIEDCEDAWNEDTIAEVTASADSSDKKVGSNSAKFAIGADFTTGIIGYEQLSATNISGANFIRLWIKSDKVSASGDIQLLLDNTAKCASPVETLNIPALLANTWTQVYLPLVDRESDTAIISIGLKLNKDNGAQNIWVDDVNTVAISSIEIPVSCLWQDGVSAQIEMSNDTALGALDAFDCNVLVSAR